MSALTKAGLDYSRVTVLVMLVALTVGLLTYLDFPKREDPAITVRTAIVIAQNDGLTPFQIEEFIARPLEEAVGAINGVSEVRTQLTGGMAILQVDIEDYLAESDLKPIFDEIRDDVADTARLMPEGTLGPVVNTDFGDVAIATIAVTGEGFSIAELKDVSEQLRDRLYAIEEVAAVTLYGVQDEVVTLEIERSRLGVIGDTLKPIVAALQGQNVRLAAGSVVNDDIRVPIRASGDSASLEDIKSVLVELPGLGLIRLGDLVSVKRGYESPLDSPVYQDGKQAVLLSVEMADGVDITSLGPVLEEVAQEFAESQPLGIEVVFSTLQSDIVSASVNGALVNMGQTFVVVLLTMLLFLGWRQAFVIAAIVPFAVSFSFALMGPVGVDLQQVSIAAIIISLGLLVDNGLVIVEDMDRRISLGEKPEAAALASGSQYTLPLAIASITTVSAFLPLFLLDGTKGEYGYSLGAVVMLMLIGSFLSALYLLPRLAVWTLSKPRQKKSQGAFFSRLVKGYGWLVRGVIKAPIVVIVLGLALVALGGSLMGKVPKQMFPLSERAQFLVYMDMQRGTDISVTRDTALRFSDWLEKEVEGVTGVTVFVGSGGPRFVLSLDPADSNPASAFMVVNTDDFKTSVEVLDQARKQALTQFPEADFRIKRLAMGGREPGVDVEISGPDADRLLAAAYEVQAAFATAPGTIVQNRNNWGEKVFEGQIQIAQDRIREYGLSSQQISNVLKGFFDGMTISTFRQGDDLVPIVLRGRPEDRDSYEAVANAVVNANGQLLSLDQFSHLQPALEFSSVRRIDQRRTITVSAISEGITAFELHDHVKPVLKRLEEELGPEYKIFVGGEIDESSEVREKLGGGFPAAGAVMLLALMIQFNSFRRVAVTFLSVPLVIVGVPLSLLAFGQPLSFFGTLGLIALSGIIINNAIVLIDQIDIERVNNTVNEAIAIAAQKRFRPIILTSLTTVIGLVPMAAAGGAMWEPMATLMIGGLGLASLLTLFWVPALYRLVFRD